MSEPSSADPASAEPAAAAAQPQGIRALKASTTRVEPVSIGGPVDESDTAVFEGLHATSTRTESVDVDDLPLVVLDEDDSLDTDSDELNVPTLVGEIKRLRSQGQILRTERTAIAGRKYALEVVIESLREKVEQADLALSELEDPALGGEELSALIAGLRLTLGDARRIADTKAVLEQDLEAERRRHLEERQAFEQRNFAFEQALVGLREERDSLRETVARVENDRLDYMERLAEVQERLEDEEIARGKVESEAEERLAAYAEQAQSLGEERAAAEAARAEALAERDQVEAARADIDQTLQAALAQSEARDGELEQLREQLAQGEEQRAELEAQLAAARDDLNEAREARAEAERVTQAESSAGVGLQTELAARTSERDALSAERDALCAERDALSAERDALTVEHDALSAERDSLSADHDALSAERDALTVEHDALCAERDALSAEHDALTAAHEGLSAARAELNAEVERLAAEGAELRASAEALTQERDAARSARSGLERELGKLRDELKGNTTRVHEAQSRLQTFTTQVESDRKALEERVRELEASLSASETLAGEQRQALRDVKPLVEDWSRLDKECQRLARLVGEARSRGRVDVQELIARAALLRRLERLTE